jgi:hypothetical protein
VLNIPAPFLRDLIRTFISGRLKRSYLLCAMALIHGHCHPRLSTIYSGRIHPSYTCSLKMVVTNNTCLIVQVYFFEKIDVPHWDHSEVCTRSVSFQKI